VSESLFEQYKAALRRGHVAALAGELDDALAAYDLAGRLVPERALPLASRGTVLHRLERWPEAAAAFDAAIQIAPDDEAALRARASARADRGLRTGAAADYERLAFVLDVAGRAAPAADAARRAAELEPSDARQALADRLGAAATNLANLAPASGLFDAESSRGFGDPLLAPAPEDQADGPSSIGDEVTQPADFEDLESAPDDPWSAALDVRRLRGLEDDDVTTRARITNAAAYDALEALRADLEAEELEPAESGAGADAPDAQGDATAGAGGTVDAPADVASAERNGTAPATGTEDEAIEVAAADANGTGGAWPPVDLPSPPPPPMVGPPPDPEELLAEAALVLEAGEVDAARDLMLTAAAVHRTAGRIDAALEICLNLLSIAPGDPRVHLAIANLQLDRGWTGVATEKIDLLVRLTSLTGDTQAEADVHGLASERLRDEPAPSTATS
jgi:tetratricopeptide (TPR) repeat protein